MSAADTINWTRNRAHLSWHELAVVYGVPTATVQAWATGSTTPHGLQRTRVDNFATLVRAPAAIGDEPQQVRDFLYGGLPGGMSRVTRFVLDQEAAVMGSRLVEWEPTVILNLGGGWQPDT